MTNPLRRTVFALSVAAPLAAAALLIAQTPPSRPTPTPVTPATPSTSGASGSSASAENKSQQSLAIAQAVLPSLVRVEYTVQFDKGDAPEAAGWSQRCPSCGQFHGNTSAESLVTEDRPMEIAGFLVEPHTVITSDPIIHPRFIKSIAVRQGDAQSAAKLKGILKDRSGLVLTLDEPLKGAQPLVFDANLKGPYSAVTYSQGSADWVVRVEPAGGAVMVTTSDRKYLAAPSFSLITDGAGKAVGLCMSDRMPMDGSWKGSPDSWPMYSAEEMEALRTKLTSTIDRGLAQVTLTFRSPRATSEESAMMRYRRGGGDDDDATVRHANGVLVDDNTVLVLIDLKPKQTARLEKIRVQVAGDSTDAKFERTLKDYGGLVAKLDKPIPGALKAADTTNVHALRDVVLPTAEVLLQGDKRTMYLTHRRIPGYTVGYKRQHNPDLPVARDESLFLFTENGELAVLPIARRQKGDSGDRYSAYRDSSANPTLVGYLWPAIAGDAAEFADASNVPLSETQESRVAWLGVELQPLSPDLARENGVSDQTSDGETGALVTYVYPDSPAAKAGVVVGQIFLRLHSLDVPKPIDIIGEYGGYGEQAYPWDRFDELPEEYFERIPRPWPAVENALTRSLTDLGFGKKVELEIATEGKVERKAFDVVEGPTTFDTVSKFKFEPLGITVRDLTYEVRRYFQIPEGDPGIIIGKIEIGSRASTSGLKPYELITHVNDQPVKTIQEFEAKAKDQSSLRLSIKRMNKARQVNLALGGETSPKPAGDAPSGEAEPSGGDHGAGEAAPGAGAAEPGETPGTGGGGAAGSPSK